MTKEEKLVKLAFYTYNRAFKKLNSCLRMQTRLNLYYSMYAPRIMLC